MILFYPQRDTKDSDTLVIFKFKYLAHRSSLKIKIIDFYVFSSVKFYRR